MAPSHHPRNVLVTMREQKGWTQTQIAEQLGTTQANISKWESNPTALSIDQLMILARTYGCPVEALLSGLSQQPEPFGGIDCGAPYKNLDHDLELLELYLKDHLEDYTKSIQKSTQSNDIDNPAQIARSIRKFQRKPAVAAVGAFDAGKSTLLNTLIGARHLPEDYQPTTKLITRIYHYSHKPDWLRPSENVVILKQTASVDDIYEMTRESQQYITAGTYDLIKAFGARTGEFANDMEADSIVAYVDAPILRSCHLIDFPGYAHNQIDEDKASLVTNEADVIIYLSPVTGFMKQDDIARLAPIIDLLPLFENHDPQFPSLGNLMIVASHAYRNIPDEKLRHLMGKATDRIVQSLSETRLKRRSGITKRLIGGDVIAQRIFPFQVDDPPRREDFFSFFQKMCGTYLPIAWSHRVHEEITLFKANAKYRCKEEIHRWESAVKKIEDAAQQLDAIEKAEPEREKNLRLQRKRIEESIAEYKLESDRAVKEIMRNKWLNPEDVKREIRSRYTSKEQAQETALVYVLEQIQADIEMHCRKSQRDLQGKLDALLHDYTIANVDALKISLNELLIPDFDAKGAFVSGLAGMGAIGILTSLVSASGVSLMGTSFLFGLGGIGTLLAMLGGPVGIVVGLVVSMVSWAFFGQSWEEGIANTLVHRLRERNVEGQFRTVVARLWSETEAACARGMANVEVEYLHYIQNLRELIHKRDGGASGVEMKLKAIKKAQLFFEGLPWPVSSGQ